MENQFKGLVLGRGLNQAVMIGNNVKVTVVQIRGGKVRLHFAAPKEIPIHRLEYYKELKQAAEAAK